MQVLAQVDRAPFVKAMAAAMPDYEKRFGKQAIEQFHSAS